MKYMPNQIHLSVERLIAQYKEYCCLEAQEHEVKEKYQEKIISLAKTQGKSVREIIEENSDAELYAWKQAQDLIKKMRERVADEMTFPLPEIWMRYKALAYQGSDKEIRTWGEFMQHCQPSGYICTKRYAFLHKAVQEREGVAIHELPAQTPLIVMCDAPWLREIQEDDKCMSMWLAHEFFMKDNQVAKWQDVA